jgi:O-6-methylguanine DNA methyltransferase
MTEFQNKVYQLTKLVPHGKVTSYGAIARALGKNCAQAVGQALHANPNAAQIPCHRIVDASGNPARNFAFGGASRQIELLRSEGITFLGQKVDMKKHFFNEFFVEKSISKLID